MFALVDGEDVEHAVQGSRGISGVQGAEDEVTGFGCRDGQRDGFKIAHFADHYDIRIFAQSAAQGGSERLGVRVHFALVDLAAVRSEQVFDRILQRDDVLVTRAVHFLHERSQRGAFAAADRSSDQHESVLVLREHLELRRQPELVHGPHIRLDNAENEIVAQTVPHHARAVAPAFIRVGEIHVTAVREQLFLRIVEESHGEALGVGGAEFVRLQPDRLQRSKAPPSRRDIDAQMDVRGARLFSNGEVLVDVRQRVDVGRALFDDLDGLAGGGFGHCPETSNSCGRIANSKRAGRFG